MKELGYSTAQKINDIDLDKAIGMLNADCPVFAAGIGKVSDAHAWVIDGYVQRTRTKTLMYSNGQPAGSPATETWTLVHCNYGWWKGKANGYYNFKIFNTKNGAVEVETDLDPDGSNNTTSDWSVNGHYRMITYSK